MAKSSFYLKWFLALMVIVAILVLVYLTHLPETDEEIPEQVEEIEWQDVDRVEIIADEEVYIVREKEGYQLLKDDSIYQIDLDAERVHSLFQTFNNFKEGRPVQVDFNEWIKSQPDTSAIMLRIYRNTEEVLNLYIHPGDRSTYYRYLDSDDVYSTQTISKEQFEWLDSLQE
jgi:hypothetical protein